MLLITDSSSPYLSIDPDHLVSTHCDGRSGLGKRVSGDIGRTAVLTVVMGSEKWGRLPQLIFS